MSVGLCVYFKVPYAKVLYKVTRCESRIYSKHTHISICSCRWHARLKKERQRERERQKRKKGVKLPCDDETTFFSSFVCVCFFCHLSVCIIALGYIGLTTNGLMIACFWFDYALDIMLGDVTSRISICGIEFTECIVIETTRNQMDDSVCVGGKDRISFFLFGSSSVLCFCFSFSTTSKQHCQ